MSLTPLLMPSGPQWNEKFTESDPPTLVHYDWHHYRVNWHPYVADRLREWPHGAFVCEIDRALDPLAHREFCQDVECVTMGWRFAIGPDLRPWEPGDSQPQDGHWPISIAVFGRERVDEANARHVARMRGSR